MSIASDIQNILDRTDITDDEKRVLIYQLKSGRVGEQAAALVGRSFTLGDGYSVTITRAPFISGRGDLYLWFTATKDGSPVPFDTPLIIRNVPVIHEGVESPLAALRQVVLDAVRRVG